MAGHGQEVQRRCDEDATIERHRQALDRRQADAQAGEAAGAGGGCEQVDVGQVVAMRREQRNEVAREPHRLPDGRVADA